MTKTNHSKRSRAEVVAEVVAQEVCVWECAPRVCAQCVCVCAVVWHGYFGVNINYVCWNASSHTRINAPQSMLHCGCLCLCECLCWPTSFLAKETGNRMLLTLQFDIIDACRTKSSHLTWQFVSGCININFNLQFIFPASSVQ